METNEALGLIEIEFTEAQKKFSRFNNSHEGYAVILEELDEMWDEIKANRRISTKKEAVQVGAMALRFLGDLY